MYDWDYNMYVKEIAPYIHPKEYKSWRKNGLAFEWRLIENKIPNRTYGSYIPGYNKKEKQNVAVRGFWGDILQTPYIPYGLEIWKEPENKKFFEKINYQLVYSCLDVSKFNVQYYIQKLEDLTEYHFPFEKVKHIKEQLSSMATDKDDDEPKVEEVTEEEAKKIEESKTFSVKDDIKEAAKKLQQPGKQINLSNVDEGGKEE
jgi:dynein assembly factor 3